MIRKKDLYCNTLKKSLLIRESNVHAPMMLVTKDSLLEGGGVYAPCSFHSFPLCSLLLSIVHILLPFNDFPGFFIFSCAFAPFPFFFLLLWVVQEQTYDNILEQGAQKTVKRSMEQREIPKRSIWSKRHRKRFKGDINLCIIIKSDRPSTASLLMIIIRSLTKAGCKPGLPNQKTASYVEFGKA